VSDVTDQRPAGQEAAERFRDSIGYRMIMDILACAPALVETVAWAQENATHPDVITLSTVESYIDCLELADNVREHGCAEGVAQFMGLLRRCRARHGRTAES
jgi:hypothetical protein